MIQNMPPTEQAKKSMKLKENCIWDKCDKKDIYRPSTRTGSVHKNLSLRFYSSPFPKSSGDQETQKDERQNEKRNAQHDGQTSDIA